MSEPARQVRAVGVKPARLATVPKDEEVPPVAAPRDVTISGSVQTVTVRPQTVNLEIYEGDDFFIDIYVVDQNQNPVDCTNMSALSQIRATPDGPAILASFNIQVDATTTNILHLHLAALDSNGLPPTCAWDIQFSTPNVVTIAAGSVSVQLQVTE